MKIDSFPCLPTKIQEDKAESYKLQKFFSVDLEREGCGQGSQGKGEGLKEGLEGQVLLHFLIIPISTCCLEDLSLQIS